MHQQLQHTAEPPRTPAVCVIGDEDRASTLATDLATALGAGFIDGDLLHPRGRRSDGAYDRDHWDWLSEVGRALHAPAGRGIVMACTGLTFRCREIIRWEAPRAVFVRAAGTDRRTEPDLLDLTADPRHEPAALARFVLEWAATGGRIA